MKVEALDLDLGSSHQLELSIPAEEGAGRITREGHLVEAQTERLLFDYQLGPWAHLKLILLEEVLSTIRETVDFGVHVGL